MSFKREINSSNQKIYFDKEILNSSSQEIQPSFSNFIKLALMSSVGLKKQPFIWKSKNCRIRVPTNDWSYLRTHRVPNSCLKLWAKVMTHLIKRTNPFCIIRFIRFYITSKYSKHKKYRLFKAIGGCQFASCPMKFHLLMDADFDHNRYIKVVYTEPTIRHELPSEKSVLSNVYAPGTNSSEKNSNDGSFSSTNFKDKIQNFNTDYRKKCYVQIPKDSWTYLKQHEKKGVFHKDWVFIMSELVQPFNPFCKIVFRGHHRKKVGSRKISVAVFRAYGNCAIKSCPLRFIIKMMPRDERAGILTIEYSDYRSKHNQSVFNSNGKIMNFPTKYRANNQSIGVLTSTAKQSKGSSKRIEENAQFETTNTSSQGCTRTIATLPSKEPAPCPSIDLELEVDEVN